MCLPATYLRDGKVCEACAGRVPWRGVLHACYRGSRGASGALGTSLALHRAIRTFERVDAFLAVSRFVRDKHVEAGFDPKRIRVKSNFSWSSQRRVGPGGPVLFLGRIDHQKGLDVVLRASPRGVKLLVAGDGPERVGLEHGANPEPISRAGRSVGCVRPPPKSTCARRLVTGTRRTTARHPRGVRRRCSGARLTDRRPARARRARLERLPRRAWTTAEVGRRRSSGSRTTRGRCAWARARTGPGAPLHPRIAIRELEDGYSAALAASRPSRRPGSDGHGYFAPMGEMR